MATRDRSRSRTRSAFDDSQPHNDDLTPKAGTKRLFSDRFSTQPLHDENENANTADGESYSGKRQRSSDWPLPSASPSSVSSARQRLRNNRNAPNSPSFDRRHRSSSLRPSKFVEGSMNDRVSAKPPVPYLDPEEEFLTQYDNAGCGDIRGRKLTRPKRLQQRDTSISQSSAADQSETSRHSSIFRFGKSIAASFNPTNWKFWSKEQDMGDDEEAAQLKVLLDRQVKAEKLYQEMKESGHFRDAATGSRVFQPASERKPAKHDSGVEFGDVRDGSTVDEKRRCRVFLDPPNFPQYGESPASNYSNSIARSSMSTPRQPKFALKKHSFSNIKKPSLSNIKNAFVGDSTLGLDEHQASARRIPSRKDLQKAQKLVKRVSNLEERLKQAREQLADALNEPVPALPPTFHPPAPQSNVRVGRARFVPGALASLPSERLLSGYVDDEDDDEDEEEMLGIGQAVTTDDESGYGSLRSRVVEKSSVESFKPSPSPSLVQRQETAQVETIFQEELTIETTSMHGAANVESQTSEIATPKSTRTGVEQNLEEEITPKDAPSQPQAEPTKKRKSIFDRVPDDGGDYNPSEATDSDEEDEVPESDVVSSVASVVKPAVKSAASPSRGQGKTITLTYPRKLQKVVPGPKTTQKQNVNKPFPHKQNTAQSPPKIKQPAPPTRSAPLPPQSKPQHAPKKVNLAPYSPSASKLTKPPPSERQQSASPPPSASTFTGSGLAYAKPSLKLPKPAHQQDAESGTYADQEEGCKAGGIPPMPPMPKAVRLASGEVVNTAGNVAVISAVAAKKAGKLVAKQKVDAAERGEFGGDGAGEQKEQKGLRREDSARSFEWPDDVF